MMGWLRRWAHLLGWHANHDALVYDNTTFIVYRRCTRCRKSREF